MHRITNSFQIKNKLLVFLLGTFIILWFGCNSKSVPEIEEGRLQINGIEIYYKIVGVGYPTFILHGGPGLGHDHMLQLTNLSDRYKLIFYDQRAAGRSTGYADTASHTIENLIDDLEQLRLSLVPGKINIVGGSWGAMLAMQYAMEYTDNINALVLLGSMGGSSSGWMEEFSVNIKKNRTTADSLTIAQIESSDEYKNRVPEVIARYTKTFFRSYFYNQNLADSIKMWIPDSAQKKIEGRYGRIYRYFDDYNIHDDLKRIKCPTLIVHGDADVIPVYVAERLNKSIEKSKLIILPNVGHFLWIEAPDEIYRVIDEFFQSI